MQPELRPREAPLARVTVAVDGSEPSRTALELALAITGPECRLTLVSVVPAAPAYARHPTLAAPLLDALRADARSYLEAAGDVCADQGRKPHPVTLEGEPAEALCAYLDHHPPDLVVLGSRGLSPSRLHLLGSVSSNVARASKAPVLVARAAGPVRSILAPVDGSDPSLEAARWAGARARDLNARLTLLYVIPQGIEEVKFTVTRAAAHPFLGPLAEALTARGTHVEKAVEYGRPAETILRAARRGKHDLVALGASGRGGQAAGGLGGVADKVLHLASTSTVIVR